MVKSFEQMKENVSSEEATVFDSRSRQVYEMMGHIHGNVNLPFTEVLTEDRTFKDAKDILALFNVKPDEEVILSCQ